MKRVEGSAGVTLLECTNPVKGKWRVRWDVEAKEDGSASYMEEDFNHKPSVNEVREVVLDWYNADIDAKIISGFKWQGKSVWLSTENQFNYKAAYDLAVQTGGQNLPVTFKLGTDEEPVYHEFKDTSELTDFYTKAIAYIQEVLARGWKEKDSFDFSKYTGNE